MKIQLDTTNKTVKIEDDVKVKDLIKVLKKLLPDDWEDFELQTNVTINNWNAPVYIEKYPSYPRYPWYEVTCKSDSAEYSSLKAGTYNIEC